MGVLDYSTTPSSNTAIGGIGIAGSDSIKNGDDAMRQMMADTRAAVTRVADKTAGSYTAAKSDHNQMWRVTGAATINLTAAATLTAGWCLWVMADGATATIDPASSEQINGASTLSLEDGNSALIICTATAFRAVIFTKPFDDSVLGDAAFLDVGTTTSTVAAGDDSRIDGALPKSGGTMTGDLTLKGDPTTDLMAASKQYVDARGIGIGQTWQDVSSSRAAQTAYQNTTGKQIQVAISVRGANSTQRFRVSADGLTYVTVAIGATSTSSSIAYFFAIVPPGHYYKIERSVGSESTIDAWMELR